MISSSSSSLRQGLLAMLSLAVLFAWSSDICAQDEQPYYVVEMVVVDGDTIPMVMLAEFSISERRTAKSRRYKRRYGRIKKKVLRAYPYAEVCKNLLEDFDRQLALLDTEKEKAKFVDEAEHVLKSEFEGELRNLTVTEGRILIKLIDRETGETSYDLVKRLKGGFNAFMWQGVAKLIGSDLKDEYDAEGDDAIIEDIVQAIERGELKPLPREPVTTKAQKRLERKEKRKKDKES